MSASSAPTAHVFTFFRSGGLDQVRIDAGAIANLKELDWRLWTALSCPVKGLEFDERTLALMDSDGDGRVRVNELLKAVAFVQTYLVDLDGLGAGTASIDLDRFLTGTPDTNAMLACARRVLATVGRADARAVTLADVDSAKGVISKTRFNGDGVLPPAVAEVEAERLYIADALACGFVAKDEGGDEGLSRAGAQAFLAAGAAYLAWHAGGQNPTTLPLGDGTAAAAAAVVAVRAKVDDFFLRCRMAAFDGRAGPAFNRADGDFAALAARDLNQAGGELAAFPLARVAPGQALPRAEGLNPLWSAAVATLFSAAVVPLLGDRDALTEADWLRVKDLLAPFQAWQGAKAGAAVESLGVARLRAHQEPAVVAGITALHDQDEAVRPEFAALAALERLVRLHRDLDRLCHNFVNFADFYGARHQATFQVGTLFLDQRAMDLCVRVEDMGKHSTLAVRANAYLIYCTCTRPGEAMTICAAVTDGDSEGLTVGRNGVFVDRKGRDWDATVAKVMEAPISIREAFWMPYKRLLRYVEDFAAKRAAEADKAADAKLTAAANAAGDAAAKGKDAAAKPKFDVGTVAALGVAVGGITTAMGLVLNAFFGLGWLMPLGLLGLIMAISGPSMALAALKLRARNLGPILDANGWAVNGRVKITIPLGTALTRLGRIPSNAKRLLSDPYAEKTAMRVVYLSVLLVALAVAGILWHRYTHTCWLWEAEAWGGSVTTTTLAP